MGRKPPPPPRGQPSLLVQRMRESGWTDTAPTLSLEGLNPYDAFHDPRCPRALRTIFNEQRRAKARTVTRPVAIKASKAVEREPVTRPIVNDVPFEAPGLPLLVASTTRQHGGPGVTYEKLGAGYATELDVVRLALRRNDCLRRAHAIVEKPAKAKTEKDAFDEDDQLVRALKERDGKTRKGPPKGLKKVVDELRVLTRKVAGLLAQRRSLLGSTAPSFDLGGQPYVFTILSDVEFLDGYGKDLDYTSARRNPLLLPHAHPGFDDLRGDDFVPSAKRGRKSVVRLPHFYGANTDAEKQLLVELRAMPRGVVRQYVDSEAARNTLEPYEPPPTIQKVEEEAPATVAQPSFFQSTMSDRTSHAQRHLEFTRAEQRRGRRRQREASSLVKEYEAKILTLRRKKDEYKASLSGPPSFKHSVRIAKLEQTAGDLDKKRRDRTKAIYTEREALVRRDRRIKELERDVRREEKLREERRAAKTPKAPEPLELMVFSPTILRHSISAEPSALLTASVDVQQRPVADEPSALTQSLDEAPSRLLRFEDSDFEEGKPRARFASVSAEPSALFTASLEQGRPFDSIEEAEPFEPSALTSSLHETDASEASAEIERLRVALAESARLGEDTSVAHAAEIARLESMLAQRDRALRDESVTLHGAEIQRLQDEARRLQDALAEREATSSEAARLQAVVAEREAPAVAADDSSAAYSAEIRRLETALAERERAARDEAERLRREKAELENRTLELRTTLERQEAEARKAYEERDAVQRRFEDEIEVLRRSAARAPAPALTEPSALSNLGPDGAVDWGQEDSELEGGATVGPQATVYTQTAQFAPLDAVADERSTASSTIMRPVHPERAVAAPPPGTPMLLEDPDVEATLLAYGLAPPGRTRPRPPAVSFAAADVTAVVVAAAGDSTVATNELGQTDRRPLARAQTWAAASPASWELGSMTPLGR